MEDRTTQAAPAEQPAMASRSSVTVGPPHLADPRALTILTTEHWSQLSARSLVYNEAFARAGMFLTFLTGSLVALGFVSQANSFGSEFLVVAAALLGVDMLIGIATLGRVSAASAEEFRSLQAMNRLRHAYLEMVPSLEPYFSASHHDDLAGVLGIYGATRERPFPAGNLGHAVTTMPGMVAMITSLAGGGCAASIALLAGATPVLAIPVAVLAVVLLFSALTAVGVRTFAATAATLDVRFPHPPGPPTPEGGPPGTTTAGRA